MIDLSHGMQHEFGVSFSSTTSRETDVRVPTPEPSSDSWVRPAPRETLQPFILGYEARKVSIHFDLVRYASCEKVTGKASSGSTVLSSPLYLL